MMPSMSCAPMLTQLAVLTQLRNEELAGPNNTRRTTFMPPSSSVCPLKPRRLYVLFHTLRWRITDRPVIAADCLPERQSKHLP